MRAAEIIGGAFVVGLGTVVPFFLGLRHDAYPLLTLGFQAAITLTYLWAVLTPQSATVSEVEG